MSSVSITDRGREIQVPVVDNVAWYTSTSTINDHFTNPVGHEVFGLKAERSGALARRAVANRDGAPDPI
ncbi:MAG: hypothetical protein ACXVII_45360 [Solirubrobacteraceae bacterium]